MSDHDELHALIAPVALGAATDQERAAVERHSASCRDCRAELDALRAAAGELALDVPQIDPPAALKGKVMDRIHAEGARVSRSPVRPRRRLSLWPALVGALSVLAAGLLAWNVTLRGDDPRQITFVGTSGASGDVTLTDDGTAVMRVRNLPALRPDQGYELWTIRDGTPRSEGFAAVTTGGEVVVATADLEGVEALAITPEVRTNTAAPSVDPIVAVEI